MTVMSEAGLAAGRISSVILIVTYDRDNATRAAAAYMPFGWSISVEEKVCPMY